MDTVHYCILLYPFGDSCMSLRYSLWDRVKKLNIVSMRTLYWHYTSCSHNYWPVTATGKLRTRDLRIIPWV